MPEEQDRQLDSDRNVSSGDIGTHLGNRPGKSVKECCCLAAMRIYSDLVTSDYEDTKYAHYGRLFCARYMDSGPEIRLLREGFSSFDG